MARLITTVGFTGKAPYDGKGYGAFLVEWENTTGRTVCVAVRIKAGKTGGLLANSAANFRVGLSIDPTPPALEPLQTKNIAASTSVIIRPFNTIDVQNGETLTVHLSSDNAGDTDVDGDVLLFDMMTGIDVRAIGGEAPMSKSDVNSGRMLKIQTLRKNVASQKVAVFAFDTAAGAAKTSDAGNITAQISKDGGASAAINDTNPTELDTTNHPGIYIFDLTQAETNADLIVISASSSTSDIVIEPVIIQTLDAQVTTTLMADTGITAGGTWTFEKIMKVLTAWAAGRWRDKSDPPDGVYEVLDPDDDSTVIAEVTPSETTPQKQVTIL